MPSKNTVFPCVAAVLFIKQRKDLLLGVQLQHRCVLYWLKLCSLTPQLAFLPNTSLLYTLPRFPCNYKEIVALKKKKKACSKYFWLACSCCLFPMPTESDKSNFKIIGAQTENIFLASYQNVQTLPYCTLQFSSGWSLDTSIEKQKK